MKNIHLIPTNNPSKLCIDSKDVLYFSPRSGFSTIDGKRQIYITSDEEIKDGNWVYYLHNSGLHKPYIHKVVNPNYSDYKPYSIHFVSGFGVKEDCKKIILTTDQDLIKDGVQAIDDEFLEWFVKNPSCEYVETRPYHIIPSWLMSSGKPLVGYKIIIPKEEPYTEAQQKSLELNKEFAENSNLEEVMSEFDEDESYPKEFKYDINTCRYFDIEAGCENENCICANLESKQATPEEVTLEKIKFLLLCNNNTLAIRAIEEYGLYKQEKMYSEEDMKEAFIAGGNSFIEEDDAYGSAYHKYMEEWFEQFKKKQDV